MPRQRIDPNLGLAQPQGGHQIPAQGLDIALDLADARLLQAAAPLRQLVHGQLLRRRAVDVVRQGRDGGGVGRRGREERFGRGGAPLGAGGGVGFGAAEGGGRV